MSWWTWPSRGGTLPPVWDGGPMARRTFEVIDVTEILVHWHAGRSLNEMSQSLGVDRKTMRKYIAPAVGAGSSRAGRRGARRSGRSWSGSGSRSWRYAAAAGDLAGDRRAPRLHRGQLKAGVRMSTICQRLRDEHGLAASVASFRRYVAANVRRRPAGRRSWCGTRGRRGRGAGADRLREAGRWLDPLTGKLRTVWAFVMVLACSRHMFVRPVLRMDQRLDRVPRRGVAFFGGVRPAWSGQPEDRGRQARLV